MKYLDADIDSAFKYILCGQLHAEHFIHMQRTIPVQVMIIVEEGVLNIAIDGTEYKVSRGEMILLPAGVSHRGFHDSDSDKPLRYFWVHFLLGTDHEYCDQCRREFRLPVYFRLCNYDRVKILYNHLLDVSLLTNMRKKYCDFLFSALCCEISEQFGNANMTGNNTVNKVIAFIEANIHNKLSLESVALQAGYNKQYISRLFKKHTGISVNGYIIKKKLELAKQLLTGSDISVSETAEKTGFDDSGYFMRVFKKHEGMTCLQYKNAYSKLTINNK